MSDVQREGVCCSFLSEACGPQGAAGRLYWGAAGTLGQARPLAGSHSETVAQGEGKPKLINTGEERRFGTVSEFAHCAGAEALKPEGASAGRTGIVLLT